MLDHENVKLEKKLGEGTFGIVYRVVYRNVKHALKIEKVSGSIKNEARVLRCLRHPSIPTVMGLGSYRGFSFLLLPLYKISLVQILYNYPDFFTSMSVAAIGWNLLDVFEYMHLKGVVYRDTKPENIMIGFDNKIYLIDFGLCTQIRSKGTRATKLVGTVRYASINAHNGVGLCGKDDLESLMYVLVYLVKKSLPWCKTDDKNDVKTQKESTSARELCSQMENEAMWTRFAQYIYARDIISHEDYEDLKLMLIGIIRFNRDVPRCTLLPGFLSCCKRFL